MYILSDGRAYYYGGTWRNQNKNMSDTFSYCEALSEKTNIEQLLSVLNSAPLKK